MFSSTIHADEEGLGGLLTKTSSQFPIARLQKTWVSHLEMLYTQRIDLGEK